jgi:hypothetical protein
MGTCCSVSLIFLIDMAMKIIAIMNAGIITEVVRKPSGMCVCFSFSFFSLVTLFLRLVLLLKSFAFG